MRSKALIKIFVALFVVISITAFSRTGNAEAGVITGEKALGGVSYYLNLYYNEVEDIEGASGNLLADSVQIPDNVAIANVNVYLNIRSGPGTEYSMIGCLPKDGMCVVIEDLDSWAKIESGNVTGYVSKDYLIMGEEGRKKAEEITMLMAKVEAGTVNFRSEPDTTTDDNILATVSRGESLIVIEETIVSKDDSQSLWV